MSVGLSNGQTASDEQDTFLAKMFNYANTHNLKALEKLRDQIEMKKDRNLSAAYSLALYIAAPKKYRQQYVDNFPTDSEGINYFNERIELKELTPSYLYIDEKVIIGINHSDGGAAELFCDSLARLFNKQLRKTLRVFSRIDEELRKKAYICFELMEAKEYSSLKTRLEKLKAKATEAEIKVIREIGNCE
jgi:hypothetical protein